MDISRGMAYGIGLSQVAVTMGAVLFSPGVEIHVFLARAHVNESAALDNPVVVDSQFQGVKAHTALPILLASALAAMFSTVTYKTHESGITGQDFQQEVLDQVPMWDLLFWTYLLLAHSIVVVTVADPVDVFGVIASTCFMTYFLHRACAPKSHVLNLTQENLNIVGYCLGVMMAAYQITETRGFGGYVLMMLVVLDYFLGVGHTYDKQPTIDTVGNCRLFYICAGTLGTAVLYVLSGETQGEAVVRLQQGA